MHTSSANNRAFLIIITIFISAIAFCCTQVCAYDLTSINKQEDVEARLKNAVDLINSRSYEEAGNILLETEDTPLSQGKKLFLLGILYKKEGKLEEAAQFLTRAENSYPLLGDYALKMLTDIYIDSKKYEEAVKTARRIKNKVLLQEAKQSEIAALLELKRDDDAISLLSDYVSDYPADWDSKFRLAVLLKNKDKTDKAINLFREIYINAVPLSEDALKELRSLKADIFTGEEALSRADHTFENGDYYGAEAAYKKTLGREDISLKDNILYKISMCQFRLKRYSESSVSFGLIKTQAAMYWQARSFFRIDDRAGYDRIIKKFEKKYPGDKQLAELLIMSAEDYSRAGNRTGAEKEFKKVIKGFPENKEEALWGLGWMRYTAGDYKDAQKYFSELTAFKESREYYKYIYWKARADEKLAESCATNSNNENNKCPEETGDFFSGLPSNEGYYGYLIKFRSKKERPVVRIEAVKPEMPDGEEYQRIGELTFLGLKAEAVKEMVSALQKARSDREYFYLGYLAKELQEYPGIINFAEQQSKSEFLPLSYPLGYWDSVERAAQKSGVDPYLIAAVIREESRFNPKAVSPAGAIGLMQLMPSTARRLKHDINVEIAETADIHDAEKNINLGAHYLSILLEEFKKPPFAIAAYNAGENALKRWLARSNNKDLDEFIEEITYKETRKYVKKVLKSYWQYRTVYGLPVEGY
ncbi:MAG: transglycosylase SLT domain-containing protein [Nitrospirae bacterium]|nr:transglycosylase SLT domain-containing protein [Nitrospirota bacterium]